MLLSIVREATFVVFQNSFVLSPETILLGDTENASLGYAGSTLIVAVEVAVPFGPVPVTV
jgi:hypothetical protein